MSTVNEEVKCNVESESEVEEEVKDYCDCWKCLDAYDGINETSCPLRDPNPIPPCLWMKDHIVPQSKANRMVYDAKQYAFGFFIAQQRLHVGEIETSILCDSPNGVELVSRRSDDCLLTREVVDEMMKTAKEEYDTILLDVKKRHKSKKEKESAGGKSKKEKTRATSPYK
jgi:hypothetical protein